MGIMGLMNSSISNFKRYPKAFIASVMLLLTTIVGGAYFLDVTDNLPAPMFSNSISLDEKFRFLRLNKNYQADYVVLGSSSGLNNFPSSAMMNHPKINQSYLNYSAWGLNITAMSYYWDFIEKIAHAKVLIIPVNVNEFDSWDLTPEFNQNDVKRYLDGANPLWYYLKYHKKGLVERIRQVIQYRRINDTQYSMEFDLAGGTPLNVTNESRITRRKWKEDNCTQERFTEKAYENLDELLKNLKQKQIIGIIVQQPLREHYKEDESDFGFIKDHWDRVGVIAKQNGAYFFNMQDILPEDPSLYSDSLHLNWWAGEIFVRKLLERMEKEGIFEKVEKMKS